MKYETHLKHSIMTHIW